METWTGDLLVAVARARRAEDVFEQIRQGAWRLGFERCAYGLRLPLPFTHPRTFLINDYDRRWQRRYEDAGYLSKDPTVSHACRSHLPLVWSDTLFRRVPDLWAEARSFGLRIGWAQSCFDGNGAVGLLSLVRSHEVLTAAEILAKEPYLRWLVNVAHTTLSGVMREQGASMPPELTTRETDILKWASDGKTNAETSKILNVSANTVKFHVKNAVFKLGAANKAAAVARAAVLRLLS